MAKGWRSVQAQVSGLGAINKSLEELVEKIDREVNRQAIRKASKPMVRRAKANARESDDSGALRRAIGVKVKTSKRRGVVSAFVGVRTGHARNGRDPSRYGHLKELGRKSQRPYEGSHFLERAFKATRREAFDIWKSEVKTGLPKAVSKVSKRAQRRRRAR